MSLTEQMKDLTYLSHIVPLISFQKAGALSQSQPERLEQICSVEEGIVLNFSILDLYCISDKITVVWEYSLDLYKI